MPTENRRAAMMRLADVRRAGVLILSPHPDDAAVSIGGLLHMSRLRPPIRIVTLFGRTNFLGTLGFQQDWRHATECRRAEDEAFAARVGVELVYCDLPEASLRIGTSRDAIFASRNRPETGLTGEIVNTLRDLAVAMRPACIVAPLGLGWHRDHLATRDVAGIVAREVRACLTYYEDLPYAALLSLVDVLRYVSSLDPRLNPVTISLGRHAQQKLRALEAYPTQITARTIDLVRAYALQLDPLAGAERLWAVNGAVELLCSPSANRTT